MFNSLSSPVVAILFLLLVGWLLQFTLSYMQLRRFYKRFNEMKRAGVHTAVGMAGGNWSRKHYAILVVDEALTIKRAEQLGGWTVFANLKTVPQLLEKPMEVLWEDEPLGEIRPRVWQAFQNAADFIDEGLEKKAAQAADAAAQNQPTPAT